MQSHEKDLRSVVASDEQLQAIQTDYKTADLTARETAILDYATKLTLAPKEICQGDLNTLRAHGLSDEQLVDTVQCVAYFNFINRVLDGLGVDPEQEMRYPEG